MTILAKLRTQHWFAPLVAEMDRLGLAYEFHAPRGKGHPKLVVTHEGRTFSMPVPCSGAPRVPPSRYITQLRRRLRKGPR